MNAEVHDKEIVGEDSEDQKFLKEVIEALQEAGVIPNKIASIAWGILGYYRQSWRRYHSVNHILDMIDKAKELDWYTPVEMRLAIIFHDIYMSRPPRYTPGAAKDVYVKLSRIPCHGHNEAVSALMVRKTLGDDALKVRPKVSKKRCDFFYAEFETIEKMIRATANYGKTDKALIEPWEMPEKDSRSDWEFQFQAQLCDLDLSSLAREPYERFVQQQRNIIAEAGCSTEVGDFSYIEGMHKCADFLKKTFIEGRGDSLFYTEEGRERWLKKAQENMNRFCDEYGSGDEENMFPRAEEPAK